MKDQDVSFIQARGLNRIKFMLSLISLAHKNLDFVLIAVLRGCQRMLLVVVLGLSLLILWLLRTTSKTATMPGKGEESPGGGPPATHGEASTAYPKEHSRSTSDDSEENCPQARSTTTPDTLLSDAASEMMPEPKSTSPDTSQTTSEDTMPRASAGPRKRQPLKFILGASEDNSSDEETVVTKPPTGASQQPTTSSTVPLPFSVTAAPSGIR